MGCGSAEGCEKCYLNCYQNLALLPTAWPIKHFSHLYCGQLLPPKHYHGVILHNGAGSLSPRVGYSLASYVTFHEIGQTPPRRRREEFASGRGDRRGLGAESPRAG